MATANHIARERSLLRSQWGLSLALFVLFTLSSADVSLAYADSGLAERAQLDNHGPWRTPVFSQEPVSSVSSDGTSDVAQPQTRTELSPAGFVAEGSAREAAAGWIVRESLRLLLAPKQGPPRLVQR